MSKSIKLTDNTYWDSSCISRNKIGLNEILDKKQDKLVDSGWYWLRTGLYCRKYGSLVVVICDIRGYITLTSGNYTTIGTIPEEMRPTKPIPFVFNFIGGTPFDGQSAFIQTNGNIDLYVASGNRSYFAFSVTYVI